MCWVNIEEVIPQFEKSLLSDVSVMQILDGGDDAEGDLSSLILIVLIDNLKGQLMAVAQFVPIQGGSASALAEAIAEAKSGGNSKAVAQALAQAQASGGEVVQKCDQTPLLHLWVKAWLLLDSGQQSTSATPCSPDFKGCVFKTFDDLCNM